MSSYSYSCPYVGGTRPKPRPKKKKIIIKKIIVIAIKKFVHNNIVT